METGFEDRSSQGRLLHSSPLDTLVRRTSSRRRQATKQHTHTSQPNASPIVPPSLHPRYPPRTPHAVSPPRPLAYQRAPDSPLLHSNFRSSTTSTSTNTTTLHTSQNSKSFLSFVDDCDQDESRCHEDLNNYANHRQQRLPASSSSHYYHDNHPTFAAPSTSTQSQTNLWPQATGFVQPPASNYTDPEDPMYPPRTPLPTVVVSSPQDDRLQSNGPMRQPIVSQSSSPRLNFSRPGRPPILSSEEQKRQVLERNARRANSPRTSPIPVSFSPVTPVTGVYAGAPQTLGHLSPSEVPSASTSPPSSSYLHPDGVYSSPSLPTPGHVLLPSHPPSLRAGSSLSLYSTSYSFYQLDSASSTSTPPSPRSSPDISPPTSRSVSTEPQTPEEYLQLGIQYHEANQLRDSAVCFEKSAKEQGGCGVGMLMWGLTLRHGWGCEKNEKSGFKWLTKAAESAVQDLEKAKKGLEVRGVKVGRSFPLCCDGGFLMRDDRKNSCLPSTRSASASFRAGG